VVTGGRDGRWLLGSVAKPSADPLVAVESGAPLHVVQFHPDGMLLAGGDSVPILRKHAHTRARNLQLHVLTVVLFLVA
jgi:hypothetical protein